VRKLTGSEEDKKESKETKDEEEKAANEQPMTPSKEPGECTVVQSKDGDVVTSGEGFIEPKQKICRFYKQKKCKFGSSCKFAHPDTCRKYLQFGLKKFNKKGCDGGCEKIHPSNICRQSLIKGQCQRENCRYQHLVFTRKPSPAEPVKATNNKVTNFTYAAVAKGQRPPKKDNSNASPPSLSFLGQKVVQPSTTENQRMANLESKMDALLSLLSGRLHQQPFLAPPPHQVVAPQQLHFQMPLQPRT